MRGQKGLTLVEVVIAVALFGIIAAALFMALNVSLKATDTTNRLTTAESLTRTVLEFVKSRDYDDTGSPDYQDDVNLEIAAGRIPVPAGYTITVIAVPIDPETHDPLLSGDQGMQKITVEVRFEGELVVATEAYKVSR